MSKTAAFTLIELLVAISVASILMMIAAPSFTQFVQNDRLASQASSLVSSLNYARSEAVKRDTPVTICASSDGSTCSASGDWSRGWLIGYFDPSNNFMVVQSLPAFGGGNTLSAMDTSTSTATLNLVFKGNSRLQTATQISFKLCDHRGGSYGRDIEVDSLGRAQSIVGAAVSCP